MRKFLEFQIISSAFIGALLCFVPNTCLSQEANASTQAGSQSSSPLTSPKEITIGFQPPGDLEAGKKGALAIAQALQEELGISVNVYMAKTYTALVEAMKSKKIEFAFLPSLVFIYAEKNAGAKVLLKKVWEEPYYYSLLIVKNNSSIKSIQDLKGKRIAFVDEKSTSGFLYPQVMLKKQKIEKSFFKEVKFSGSHAASVRLLESGETDAIAIFSDDKQGKISAWTKWNSDVAAKTSTKVQKKEAIRVLWVSEPIPNDPFCVQQNFYDQYPKLTHNLMFSLIDIVDRLKTKKEVSEFVGAKGFMPATTKQYDPVREMVKELSLKLE